MNTDDIRIICRVTTSSYEYDSNPERWNRIAGNELIMKIADILQRERCEKIRTDNMVENRIDLYVASPDVFWSIVKKEAEKIAIQFLPK